MKKDKRQGGRPPVYSKGGVQSPGTLPKGVAAKVRELIAGRHSKAAVEAAKELHKRCATAESERLLVEAYEARIRDLLKSNMRVEANALLDLVGERFPASAARLKSIRLEVHAQEGNLDALLAPLGDPNLSAEVAEKIESFIRKDLSDLSALARCSTLPADHSLRQAAAALAAALEAVTGGPVDDAVLSLPQVSRRSPLASWKALVWAIACFHRKDDDACEKWLGAIASDSAAARLVAPLRAMMGIGAGSQLSVAATRLMAAVGGGAGAVRPACAAFEVAAAAGKKKQILDRTRDLVTVCDRCCPKIKERVRQHLSVRCMLLNFSPEVVDAAMGGSARRDAYFLRLMAHGVESLKDPESYPEAVFGWEAFRTKALEEKWFAKKSPEEAVLFLHMASLVERIPPEIMEMVQDEMGDYRLPGALQPLQLLSPDCLYERSCLADPVPEAFQRWLRWAQGQKDWRVAEHVADLWRRARDQDVAPLLWLVESSEKRGSYKKALGFLKQAERLDRLNPEVGKARRRLLVASVIRHFSQRKPRLAAHEIEQLEALPGAQEGNHRTLLAALHRLCATLGNDVKAVRSWQRELEARLGGAMASFLVLRGLAAASALALQQACLTPPEIDFIDPMSLLKEAVQACAFGDAMDVPLSLPPDWEDRLSAALVCRNVLLEAAQLLVLGAAALRSDAAELAFAVSVAGMARGGADAQFLLLRARSLPLSDVERGYGCLCAALALARRERNPDLAGRILDAMRSRSGAEQGWDDDFDWHAPEEFSREPELLSEILEQERGETSFPLPGRSVPPLYVREHKLEAGDGPHYRGADRFEDEDDFCEDLEDEIDDFLDNLPPQIKHELGEAMARGESPTAVLARLLLPRPREERLPRRPSPRRDSSFHRPDKEACFRIGGGGGEEERRRRI